MAAMGLHMPEDDSIPTDRDDETGQFTSTVEADVALDAFGDRADDCEPLSAKEVAEITGLADRTAYNKLQDLAYDGKLATKKVGRNRVYWIPHSHLESFRSSKHYEQDEQDAERGDPANPGGA